MIIGAYLCSSGFVLVATLLLLTALTRSAANGGEIRQQLARFSLLAASLILFGLVVFIGLSAFTGILPIFRSGSYNLPQDYIEYGLFAWFILLIGLAGIFSPVFTALWLHRQHKLLI